MLTAERLRELLHYDPVTGVFTWKVTISHLAAGSVAGSIGPNGYVRIMIGRRSYKAHRLAFLYMTGSFPPGDVDHRDTNKANNKWNNLRPATRSQNVCNGKLRSDSRSGVKGVSWNTSHRKWTAYIQTDGKRRYLGWFETIEEAAEARRIAANDSYQEFARHA